MSELSENAKILLTTIKSQGAKYDNMGTYFTDGLVAYWYHSKNHRSALNDEDKAAIKELLEVGFARFWQKHKDEYELTPKGEAYIHASAASAHQNITNNFSAINNSNIANMSENVSQTLNIDSYNTDVREQFTELQEAVRDKDNTRVRNIIDGLWVSAPQLVLSLIQIGIATAGAR